MTDHTETTAAAKKGGGQPAKPEAEKKPGRLWRALFSTWSEAIKDKNFGAIVDWFVVWFMIIGFTAILLAAIAASFGGDDGAGAITVAVQDGVIGQLKVVSSQVIGLRIFGLGLLLAGACTCVGWLFGLLFGIPRATLQVTDANVAAAAAKTAATASSRKTSSKVNTNLEDISDWLTKTLVGVGLTQLTSLPKFLGDLASDANRYGFGWGDHGVLLALSIMLYFVPGGFWLGYVGTRTLLTGLFDLFNAGWEDHVERSAAVDNLEIDGLNKIRPATGTVVLADAAVLSKPMQALDSSDEIVAWAAAQARLGNLDAARVALENVLGSDPDNAVALRQLVKVYLASRRYDQARKLAKDLPDSPPKMLASLYDQPPGGYTVAQDIGKKLMQDPNFDNSASMHVWLACAYGQQYSNTIKPKDKAVAPVAKTDPKALALKDLVQTEIAKAIAIDPAMHEVLRDLWRPTKDDEIDNDLSAFDDSDLADLLGPAPLKTDPAPVKKDPPADGSKRD